MSSDSKQPDQPGLWDEDVDPKDRRQTTRSHRHSTQEANERPSVRTQEEPGQAERLWTVDEVAAFLRVPKKTIYGWRTTGHGPRGFRVGKHLRWHPRTVFQWSMRLEDEQ